MTIIEIYTPEKFMQSASKKLTLNSIEMLPLELSLLSYILLPYFDTNLQFWRWGCSSSSLYLCCLCRLCSKCKNSQRVTVKWCPIKPFHYNFPGDYLYSDPLPLKYRNTQYLVFDCAPHWSVNNAQYVNILF